jgi:hypothetical protein
MISPTCLAVRVAGEATSVDLVTYGLKANGEFTTQTDNNQGRYLF